MILHFIVTAFKLCIVFLIKRLPTFGTQIKFKCEEQMF